jgi:hypothetical protein
MRDILSTKLAMFYYKEIAKYVCRLSIYIPQIFTIEPNKYFNFDELSVHRFNPNDSHFASATFIIKLINYCAIAESESSLYLDAGKIITQLDKFQTATADICVPNTFQGDNINHVNEQIHKYCDLPSLMDEELISFDFSALKLSCQAAELFKKLLKQILDRYPEYISTTTGYAILSCVTAHARKSGLTVVCLQEPVIDIRDEDKISTFYAF